MTAQLLKAKEAGADAVLTYGIGPELAQIANGMTKLGWKVPMIGSWTLSMANYIDNAGPGGEGARMPQTFIQEPTTPKRQSFIVSYLKTFNPKNSRMRFAGVGGAGLRLDLPAGRGDQAGRQHRRPEGQGRARRPEDAGRRRRHDLQQAVLEGRPRRDHRATSRCSARSRAARVVYAYPDDQKKASEVRVKDVNAKGALASEAPARGLTGWRGLGVVRGRASCGTTTMQILTQLVFSGIALGMIYAVIAFGYQLTFATSDTLNFGQGDALMLGALVGLTLVGLGVNYWLMIPLVCLFGAVQGACRRAHRRAAGDQDQVGVRLDHVDDRAGHHLQERGRERLGPRRPEVPVAAARIADEVPRRQRAADGDPGRRRRGR